jgi:TPR repeat protein
VLAPLGVGALLAGPHSTCCTGNFQPDDLFKGPPLDVDEKNAQHGDLAATMRMGFAYYAGFAGRVDMERARSYFVVAAKASPAAAAWVGYVDAASKQVPGGVLRRRAAFLRFLDAATAGDPVAQTLLGRVYERGLAGYRQNVAKAKALYALAAPRFALAKTDLGRQYVNSGSLDQALPLFKAAVAAGETTAMISLASLYARQGRRKKYKTAETTRLLRNACERNDRVAMYLLGSQYQNGTHGFPKSTKQGVELLHKSAAMGYKPAQKALGTAYLNGAGVIADKDKARFWGRKANMPDLNKAFVPHSNKASRAKTQG